MKENRQQKQEDEVPPVDNPNSDCYGCDHQICRGDQYFYLLYNRDYVPPEQQKEEPNSTSAK